LFLFFFLATFYCIPKITATHLPKIWYNDTALEFGCTFFSLLFLLFIVSPALIILLDIDSIIMPSFTVYTLGYQWAWAYTVCCLHERVGFTSCLDQSTISTPLLWSRAAGASLTRNDYLISVSTYISIPMWSCIKLYCFSLDVIHSLSFYSLGFKIDAIPGRINLARSIRSFIKGTAKGFCYELCYSNQTGQQESRNERRGPQPIL
jgi:cytochrome c oxidase subunit 2